MILTCPQCATRYLLPGQSLGPEGRRVKCSNCKEIWFQYPDEKEGDGSDKAMFVDIPEGVRPLKDGSNLPMVHDDGTMSVADRRARFVGYSYAAAVFFLILAVLLIFQPSIASSWPLSRSFYSLLGYETVIASNLKFLDLNAEAQADTAGEKVVITGKIFNEGAGEEKLPLIESQMRNEKGEILERWAIRAPAPSVQPHSDIAFSTDYLHATPGAAHDIHLSFMPDSK